MNDEKEPNAVLLGGPASLARNQRTLWADAATEEIKVCCGNRYEHFVATPETADVDSHTLHVFRWTDYTQVAE
ncbi:DUF5988 family protein [Amycolatopsis sp. H20-H5]|uniref:DUF5988 family protein n=1 Tax=Amycolatopsis sp. H20-H5 TaxID=3046309 RepID=UPI002DBD98C3|nr:DUF5988 family protein [Amycolatopsis sp. H20-H5]MEC3974516.1 DUF5988 family protein [Amycolatopsis sp. H20-H5]